MVLDLSLELARHVVLAVEDRDLAFGSKQDTIPVAGGEWKITVKFDAVNDLVAIHGNPVARLEEGDEDDATEAAGRRMMARLFGEEPDEKPGEGAFAYQLPAAWLPDA